jgi:hypothetical protein
MTLSLPQTQPILLVAPVDGDTYAVDDEFAGGGTIIYLGANSSYSHTPLLENTDYYYRIWSVDVHDRYSTIAGAAQCKNSLQPRYSSFFEGFESGFTHNTAVGGCWSQQSITGIQVWTANTSETTYNRTPRTGSWNATLRYSNEDWLFYPLALTGSVEYTFEMYARQDGAISSNANITIAYGDAGNAASMTETIVPATGIVNGNYQLITGTFTPTATGTYYIGIMGWISGTPWYISIDDISIFETPSCLQPTNLNASNIDGYSSIMNWIAGDTETEWELYYGETPLTAPDASTVPTEDNILLNQYTITGLTPTTEYAVYVRANCGGDVSEWTGPVVFTTTVSCPAPSGFSITSTTSSSAEVAWISSAGEFEIEYGEAPYTFTGTANVSPNPSTNSHDFTGLQHSTTYEYKVKAICGAGDESDWSATASFATDCGIYDLPLTESFDVSTFPLCWTQTYSGGITSNRWFVNNTSNAGGSAYEMRGGWVSGTGISRLITPALNTNGISKLMFEFKTFFDDFGAGATLKIQSSNDGVNWTDENWSYASGSGNIAATTISLEIDGITNDTLFLAWVIDGNHYQINHWYVDDVVVRLHSQEADITSFTVPYQYGTSTINATTNTVDVDVFTLAYMYLTRPTLTLSDGASINPDPSVIGIQDVPLYNYEEYTVTAEDGVTQKVWTVTFTEVNHNLQTANNNGFSVDMSWDAFGCDNYIVHYRRIGTSTWTHKTTNNNSLHVSSVVQDSQYEWRVLYYNGATFMGRSQIATFNTPVFISVTKDIGTTALFQWANTTSATSYVLHYRKQGDAMWRHASSTTNQRQVWSLTPGATGETYEYRLLMWDGATYMGATPIYTFQTTPLQFQITNNVGTSVVVNWNAIQNATSYILHYREAGSSAAWRQGYTTTNSRQIWTLLPNTDYEYRLLVYYTEGYFGVSYTDIFTTMGTKELAVDNNFTNGELQVYPNPFNDLMNVAIEISESSNMAWSIFDMSGKLVLSGTQSMSAGMNNFAIEATHLPSGLYMLKANIGGTMHTARILKQ